MEGGFFAILLLCYIQWYARKWYYIVDKKTVHILLLPPTCINFAH